MNKVDLRIEWATYKAAKFAVENWHYSRCLPVGKMVKFGAWEDGRFVGAVLFGRGAAPEIGSPFGLEQTEICELVRVAFNEHKSPISKILSVAINKLRNQSPRLKCVVSFADSEMGHYGGIYQASNWIYIGSKSYHAYKVNGKIMHPKTLHAMFGKGGQSVSWLRENVDPKAVRLKNGVKHKYVLPLNSLMRVKLMELSQPYPKREKQAMAGPPEQRRGSTDLHAPNNLQ